MNPTPTETETAKTRILVVDDHPFMRQGLVDFLNREKDLTVCAEAENAAQAQAEVLAKKPDLVIADLNLPDKPGLEMIQNLKALVPNLLVLVHSLRDENMFAQRAIKVGASGYVMKVESPKKLLAAIRRVLAGSVAVSDQISDRIIRGMDLPSGDGRGWVEELTDREMEVFTQLGLGLSTRVIADQLSVTKKTIEAHRSNIKAKLKIKTAAELISFAARWVSAEDGISRNPPAET